MQSLNKDKVIENKLEGSAFGNVLWSSIVKVLSPPWYLNFYTLKLISIFSILFSIHFVRYQQEEFVNNN